MQLTTEKMLFLNNIFPPNYYIGSGTRLSDHQKHLLEKAMSDLKNEPEIEASIDLVEAVILCINEFLKIAEGEVETVSGLSEEFLLQKKNYFILLRNSLMHKA